MLSDQTTRVRIPFFSHPVRLWIFVTALIASILVGFFLGTTTKSPESKAIDASSFQIPTAVPIEARVVTDRLTLQGAVVSGSTFDVKAAAPQGTDRAVVSESFVNAGDNVTSGQLLAMISGRPLITLPSSVPLYRNMRENDQGEDVRTFQIALTDLGFPTTSTGKVDRQTLASVRGLYDRFEVIPPGGTGKEAYIDWREFTQIPADNGVILSTSPVGTVLLDQPFAVIQTAPDVVSARITVLQSEKLKTGETVRIQTGDGTPRTGLILSTSAFTPGDEKQNKPAGMDIAISVPDEARNDFRPNDPVLVTYGSDSPSSPAIPVIAIRQDAEGVYVLRDTSENPVAETSPLPEHRVYVKILRQADGWAAIETNAELPIGTKVLI